MIVGYKNNNNNNKESQYKVLHPETGSDSLIGLDWESGRDKLVSEPRFRRFWKSLCLGNSR